jgi:hypothetical protein
MIVTFTVDRETLTFTEWHDGVEIGSGDAADIEALRESGELDPALAALWDAMAATLTEDDAPPIPIEAAELLAAARRDPALWDAVLAELRKQVAADRGRLDQEHAR